MENTYLAHHGILGQKLGVRRFQREDGTRTSAGKKREAQNADNEKNAVSLKSAGHKALASVYSLNAKVYKNSNKTLSSMNENAKNEQLKKAQEAQDAANKKRDAMNENYTASNGTKVAAPKTAYQKLMRNLATSNLATADTRYTKSSFFDSKSTKNEKADRLEKIRNEQNAIKEFNARNKDIKNNTGTKNLDKAIRNTKIDDTQTSLKKNDSTFSKMLYNDATYNRAAKAVVDKHVSEKTALKSAKTAAWVNTGMIAVGAIGLDIALNKMSE